MNPNASGFRLIDDLGLERNQSKLALARCVQGVFFLRKNPLGIVLSGCSNSGFPAGAEL
jgi:hypothetical protein